ncbi:unnamed protein product [Paramecium primaurelia]|uniref:Cation/H+ exchanger transmembrane domain-containing protein n=1 Tax=Paramecium primaurelia TaxID=5886 RepID=A0A8S1JQX6_PARPR|nr:unnamed protein product [Paramecium primaurelia]
MIRQNQQLSEKTASISDAILLMMALLVLNQIIIDLFNRIQKTSPIKKFINPPMITTTIGILAGIVMNEIEADNAMNQIRKGFSSLFLIVLLPPILFESAVNMETQPFFQHFGTIHLYAIFGTLISILITTGMIYLGGLTGFVTAFPLNLAFVYGSLISATDPVSVIGALKSMEIEKMLSILIFGESILNDAVSLTSYEAALDFYNDSDQGVGWVILGFFFEFILSIIIGFLIGCLSAYILKKRNEDSQDSIAELENIIMFIVPWVSYLIAEALEFSGIVSIIFCGISMARYAIPNLSKSGRKSISKTYHSLSSTFENLTFLFIGIGLIGFDLYWDQMGVGLFLITFFAILFARLANIVSMSFIANWFRSANKINKNQQVFLWFSGFRGAMAYALSLESCLQFEYYGNIMLTMTILIAIINIYFQGAFIIPLIEILNLKLPQDGNEEEKPQVGCLARCKYAIGQFDEKFISSNLIKQEEKKDIELQDVEKQ